MIADAALNRAFEETWPAAEYREVGGFRLGRGLGAGGRVSSVRPLQGWTEKGIAQAADAMREWGQKPLFRTDQGDQRLSDALRAQGLTPANPTVLMQIATSRLTDTPVPPITALRSWPPLAIQREIWIQGGIDAARQAVMERVTLPRVSLLGRMQDRAGGAGFVAVAGDVAMLHALEIVAPARRQGLAQWMIREAGAFAAEQGATRLALAVTQANAPALSLYDKLGFERMGSYLYWS